MSLLEVEDLRAGYGRSGARGDRLRRRRGREGRRPRPQRGRQDHHPARASGMVRTRGRVELRRPRARRPATAAIARLGVAHVPEGRGTFASLTVEENLRVGALRAPRRRGVTRGPRALLRVVPAPAGASRPVRGQPQRRRAADARPRARADAAAAPADARRAVAGAGARSLTQELFRVLGQIARRGGHDGAGGRAERATWLCSFADHAYVLEAGRIALSGDARPIKDDDGRTDAPTWAD